MASVARRASELNRLDSENERNAASGAKGVAAAQMDCLDRLLYSEIRLFLNELDSSE